MAHVERTWDDWLGDLLSTVRELDELARKEPNKLTVDLIRGEFLRGLRASVGEVPPKPPEETTQVRRGSLLSMIKPLMSVEGLPGFWFYETPSPALYEACRRVIPTLERLSQELEQRLEKWFERIVALAGGEGLLDVSGEDDLLPQLLDWRTKKLRKVVDRIDAEGPARSFAARAQLAAVVQDASALARRAFQGDLNATEEYVYEFLDIADEALTVLAGFPDPDSWVAKEVSRWLEQHNLSGRISSEARGVAHTVYTRLLWAFWFATRGEAAAEVLNLARHPAEPLLWIFRALEALVVDVAPELEEKQLGGKERRRGDAKTWARRLLDREQGAEEFRRRAPDAFHVLCQDTTAQGDIMLELLLEARNTVHEMRFRAAALGPARKGVSWEEVWDELWKGREGEETPWIARAISALLRALDHENRKRR